MSYYTNMRTTKPIRCFLSEVGHNNFWYPTKITAIIGSECKYEKLNWVSGDGRSLKALKVRRECILPIEYTVKTVENISPPSYNTYTVVWVEE